MTDEDWEEILSFEDTEGKDHRIQLSDRPSGDRVGVRWQYRQSEDHDWLHVWSVTANEDESLSDELDEDNTEEVDVDLTAVESFLG
jgi:hypothetical protein